MKAEIQDQLKAVANNIRRHRLELGYPMEFMADRLGITLKAYDKIEKAHARVSMTNLFRIAEILEAAPSILVSLPEKKLAYPAIPFTPHPGTKPVNTKLQKLL